MVQVDEYAVSDEVWRDVAPLAVDADRRERRLTRYVFLAAVGVALAYAIVWWSGAFTPHLEATGSGGSWAEEPTPSGSTTIDVHNLGWFPERVTAASTAFPGLRILRVSTSPATLGGGQSGQITLDWAADCAVASPTAGTGPTRSEQTGVGADIAVTLLSRRPWGSAVHSLSLNDVGALADTIDLICHTDSASSGS